MLGRSVQFTSPAQVLEAYREQEIECFALVHQKQFMFKYEGDNITSGEEFLQKLLAQLVASRSIAVYTLCLYDNVPKGGIKPGTPYDCSFNFRFFTDSENYVAGLGGSPREVMPQIMEQLAEMREEIAELKEQREEQTGSLGEITQLLGNPVVQHLIGLLMSNGKNAPQQPAAIGEISGAAITEQQKLDAAIVVLREVDPLLGTHLYKLAQLSKSNPKKFQAILSTVELL